jgi:DNA-binding CsgD family transcriptional regulator
MRTPSFSAAQLVQLVGSIYASATDTSKVPELLQLLNAYLGGKSAHLFTRDSATGAILHSQMGGASFDDANRRYARDWGPSDPRAQWLAARPAGQVLRCHEEFDDEFVAGNTFYCGYFVPHGFRWSLAARYASGPGIETVVADLRTADSAPFEDGTVGALIQLLPHFEQAAAIALKVERQSAAVHAATDMVRRLPIPCLFTDQAGRCLEANEAFSHSFETLSLRLVTGRARFVRPDLQDKWEAALFETHTTAVATTMEFTNSAGQTWIAHLIPWLPLVEKTDTLDKKMILVFFDTKSAEAKPQLQPGSMAATARLTRAELEVLAGLLKGLPAKKIATRRSASVNTVRGQIVAILDKTGFNSQKELMASFSTSMLPDSVLMSSGSSSHSRESRPN